MSLRVNNEHGRVLIYGSREELLELADALKKSAEADEEIAGTFVRVVQALGNGAWHEDPMLRGPHYTVIAAFKDPVFK